MASIAYGNPVTRIRARETRLLDQIRINRMLETKDGEDLLKILAETEYSSLLKDIEGVEDYEKMLSMELKRIYQLLEELCPEESFLQLITLPHDLQNLKLTIKSKGKGFQQLKNHLGKIPLSSLEKALTLKGWKEITSPLGEPLALLGERILEESEPQIIDILLDGARFEITHQLLKKIGRPLLKKFFAYYSDLLNIEIFVRTKAMGQGANFLKEVLVKNGTLEEHFFLTAFREPLSHLLDKLKMTPYKMMDEGLRYWQEKGDLILYEKLRDNFLMETIKGAHFIFFGPEPLFGYLWAKETEIKTLRMIFIGKINRLHDKVIRERLRDLYG